MLNYLKKFWKTSLWIFIIFYLLFSPGNTLPNSGTINIPHLDKLVHLIMFAVLILVFLIDSREYRNRILLALMFSLTILVFAGLSEYIQFKYIPGRSGNLLDFLADCCGIVVGILSYISVVKKYYLK